MLYMFGFFRYFLFLFFVAIWSVVAQSSKKTEELVLIRTDYGEMLLWLYDQTPKHKANFLKLVREGFYDGLLFHRVIKDFVIQGGDPNSRHARPAEPLGQGDLGYRIDAEFHPALYHKRGAVGAARDNNPQKASSASQFYIVQGKTRTSEELQAIAQRMGQVWSPEQIQVYQTVGGVPHLDQNYTVFGELIAGIEVLDAIAALPTDAQDRPQQDVRMYMEVKKMKRRRIERQYGFRFPQGM